MTSSTSIRVLSIQYIYIYNIYILYIPSEIPSSDFNGNTHCWEYLLALNDDLMQVSGKKRCLPPRLPAVRMSSKQ